MNLKKGETAAGRAGLISVLLVIIKLIVGSLSGSIALISDALHSFADLTVDIISWAGLKIAQRKPDEKFHYGYYKAESLATLFISFFILYIAVNLIFEGYSRIIVVSEITMPFIALFIALISSLVSFSVSKYLRKIGETINSQALIINSKERFLDGISSIGVFVAILLNSYGIYWAEGVITIIIGAMILKIGILSLKDSIFSLMDISPVEEEKNVKEIIKKIKGVDDYSDLKLRKSGPFVFGEVKINIKKSASINKAHEIADEIESKIHNEISSIKSFIVHAEPYKSEKNKIAIPVLNQDGLNSKIMNHFGRTDYFMFLEINKKSINKFYFKENPYKKKKLRTGLDVVDFILKEKVNILVTKEIGEISVNKLRDNLVDIYKAEGGNCGEIVNKFLEGKLIEMKKPTRKKD
ncbi:MAG: hypothetical protein DRP06_04230 [Candidatus Aenigmatarchaeota archaeon]|nr:MAG: hypothetical protein DRP06_04230 [Candidatus Aenigmarchaeota archaeon]